jgi:regulator of cell morphogenesis and NO signaling
VQPILHYLRNTHFYYINQKLPELEILLNETIRVCYKEEKTQQLLIRFFSGYSEQLTRHIDKEEKEVFPYVYWLEACQGNEIVSEEMAEKYKCYSIEHYRNTHDDIEEKLADLQNLIIKYLPPPDNLYACNKLLFEIFTLENDINYHSRIEEKVLIPKSLEMEVGLKSKLTK